MFSVKLCPICVGFGWYFTKFLMSEGSLTRIYITPFMFLVTHCDSLSTMMKHLGLTGCPVEWLWWCMGDGVLRCSLSLSQKVLPDSPNYSSGAVDVWALKPTYDPTLLKFVVPILGVIRRVFIVLVPLKCNWIPKLLHVLFNLSPICGCMVPLWRCFCCLIQTNGGTHNFNW